MKKIAVDFDRVIHKYTGGWLDGSIYDEPIDGSILALNKLVEEGFEVFVLTSLSQRGEERNVEIKTWLDRYGADKSIKVTNTKHPAMAYIDDRAIRFTNWRDMLNYFI